MRLRLRKIRTLAIGAVGMAAVIAALTCAQVHAASMQRVDAEICLAAVGVPASLEGVQAWGAARLASGIALQVWDSGGVLIYPARVEPGLPGDGLEACRTSASLGLGWRTCGFRQGNRLIQVSASAKWQDAVMAAARWQAVLPILLALLAGGIVALLLAAMRSRRDASEPGAPPRCAASLGTKPAVLPSSDFLAKGLLEKLDGAINAQRVFVDDAAHALRSPLTALKLQLQLAERSATPEGRDSALTKLHERIDRCTHLVNQLLTLAHQDRKVVRVAHESVDLAQIARQSVSDYLPLASSRSIELAVTACARPASTIGVAEDISILLGNLIENALRYTPPGGRVEVRVVATEGEVGLQVLDTGPGIPAQERTRVFDRFYRGPHSDVVGAGLGLSIVKAIAEAHGAGIDLADREPLPGLGITVRFRCEDSRR
jgi:two-component system OmpR family sensor kinase